jgi:hypothetical protein
VPIVAKPDRSFYSQIVWRYTSFAKFLALLENSELFFSQPLKFEDPTEGLAYRLSEVGSLSPRKDKALKDKNEFQQEVKKFIFVSSWHLDAPESAAMWKLYSQWGEGIAIATTVGTLIQQVKNSPFKLHAGLVNYTGKPKLHEDHIQPFFRKGRGYSYEKEFRLLIDMSDSSTPQEKRYLEAALSAGGSRIKIDTKKLLKRVTVGPFAESWFKPLVDKTLKRHGLKIKASESTLHE